MYFNKKILVTFLAVLIPSISLSWDQVIYENTREELVQFIAGVYNSVDVADGKVRHFAWDNSVNKAIERIANSIAESPNPRQRLSDFEILRQELDGVVPDYEYELNGKAAHRLEIIMEYALVLSSNHRLTDQYVQQMKSAKADPVQTPVSRAMLIARMRALHEFQQ